MSTKDLISYIDDLEEIIKLLLGQIDGRIKTRDMGKCIDCGHLTPSGMDKVCRKCIVKMAKKLLKDGYDA